MNAFTATLDIEDYISTLVAEMLRRFPKGSRVKLDISEVPPAGPVPSLEEHQQMIDDARKQAPRSPWQTTAETMRSLREGEAD